MNLTGITPPAPAGFVYSHAGHLVAVRPPSSLAEDPTFQRKVLLVLPYWEGDIEGVDILAQLITQLERVFNPHVDVMFFGRKDATVGPSPSTMEAIKRRFANVYHLNGQTEGAGNYAVGFPWGANDVWLDLVGRMASAQWAKTYRCFINLEWDCVPTRPGWLNELAREFDSAVSRGKRVVGTYQSVPAPHYNGVAVYATDIGTRARITEASIPPDAAYDLYLAPQIMPHAVNTPLIKLDYRRPSISADELFASGAALYHGVRDMSAVAAVTEEHINHTPRKTQNFAAKTIYTYRAQVPGVEQEEIDAQIEAWTNGWRSNGWNPVVLGERTAQRHPRYPEFRRRVESFPAVNVREHALACWERWLALAVQGGGVMGDFDVLPTGACRPGTLPDKSGFQLLGGRVPCLVQADEVGLGEFVKAVMAYTPDENDKDASGTPCLSDAAFLQRMLDAKPEKTWISSHELVRGRDEANFGQAKSAVHFSTRSVNAALPGQSKSRAMNDYLRGL
jgi:hypothetical protein